MMRAIAFLLPLLAAAGLGCESAPPPKMPTRAAGCEVTVYRGAVPHGTKVTRLSEVVASCGKNDADSDCIRALQDEVCKLGGDVVYEVPAEPKEESDTMLRYEGIAGTTTTP